MGNQLLLGVLVSFVNFGIHALMTGLIVVATRHTAAATDDLHVFGRVSALLMVTMAVLSIAHLSEIAAFKNATAFEFAFENYSALGYGDVVATNGWRLIGPITSLNGLLLIGWSVAIVFEVMRMAEVQVGRQDRLHVSKQRAQYD